MRMLTPAGATTRICCVSTAPGLTTGFDMGSICNCCDYLTIKCVSLALNFCKKVQDPYLWHCSLETEASSRLTTRYLEASQDHHNTRSCCRRLRRKRDFDVVLIISGVGCQSGLSSHSWRRRGLYLCLRWCKQRRWWRCIRWRNGRRVRSSWS